MFPRPVSVAVAGLSGHIVGFSGDHHFGRCEIRLETSILGNTVTVIGTFGLRDWSNDWDDAYSGTIEFVVLAELEPVDPGSMSLRMDLSIVDLELNQAVQFFRSNRFLDSATAMPDNSIFMISSKDTGVRVYIDWDPTGGLPPIGRLTGSLTVRTGTRTLTLLPINPSGSIVPHRDSNVNQALTNDTLNFMIPGPACVGTITISCQLFDQDSPDNGSSGAFTRTITFAALKPLRIYLVGVATTSPGTPAPDALALIASLTRVRKMFPQGDIELTGLTTITLDQTITGCGTSCSDAFSRLLDLLRDLRGGSGDVYFGGLPASARAPDDLQLGSSATGDRLASAFIDNSLTVAHEIAHSLGRQHAPVGGVTATNPDPNFPQYGSFPDASIGVFGFDPVTNTVFDPATVLDLMVGVAIAPESAWISPHNYRGLLSPPSEGGGVPGALTLREGRTETLFLRMTIYRDGNVKFAESFHHPAVFQGSLKCEGRFSIEFLDEDKNVLDCAPLSCACEDGGCHCWPKSIRQALPFPKESRWIIVWDIDTKIHEEQIGDPPRVRITSVTESDDGILVTWRSDPKKCWYLVHWFDEDARVWRGVAPRQQAASFLVPDRLFVRSPRLTIRILATEKISTGYAECELHLQNYVGPQITLNLIGFDPRIKEPQKSSGVVRVIAVDPAGRGFPANGAVWYSEKGSELASGDSVDLRQLAHGRHIIRVVVRAARGKPVSRSWLVERDPKGFIVHSAITDSDSQDTQDDRQHPSQSDQDQEEL